jgi:hypothetical protein
VVATAKRTLTLPNARKIGKRMTEDSRAAPGQASPFS